MTALGALSSAAQVSRADATESSYEQATGGLDRKVTSEEYGTWITLNSVSVTSGTWLLIARGAVGNSAESSVTTTVDFEIRSGSTTVAFSRYANRENGTNSSTAGSGNGRTVGLLGVTTVASTTTVSLRANPHVGGAGVGIGGSIGTGYGACRLLAVRVDGTTALGGISSTTTGLGQPGRDLADSSSSGSTLATTSWASILTGSAPATACKALILGVVSTDTANGVVASARLTRADGSAAATHVAVENLTSATGRLTIPLHALVDTSASESISLSTRVASGSSYNWYSVDSGGTELGRSSRLMMVSVGGSDTFGSQSTGGPISQRAFAAQTHSTSASPGAITTTSTKYGSTLTPTEAGAYLAIATYRCQAELAERRVTGRLIRNGTVVDDSVVQSGESGSSNVQVVTLFHVGTYNGSTDYAEFRASGVSSYIYNMTLDLVRI